MTTTTRPTEITLPNGQVLRDGGLFKSKGSKVVRRFTLLTHEHDYGSSFSTDKQTGEVTRVQGISLASGESNWVRADRVVVVEAE